MTEHISQYHDERRFICPYCYHVQNDLNVPKQMYTQRHWMDYKCESCNKIFGYVQIVKRYHVSVPLKDEDKDETLKGKNERRKQNDDQGE